MRKISKNKNLINCCLLVLLIVCVINCYTINQLNINVYANGTSRSDNIGIISGTDNGELTINDLTNVKYIPNSNYFLKTY